ncbi:MAG: AbrB/MazE/SpoVT family DNA-binding domain-containing protein [Armatimonadetes bacterium]|nr:AbrB/MazE/SpoVT family DNA-binding domain-containing protein [Armatimonadota bacterium]
MPIVRTSGKGQVVIPAAIRRRAGIRAGDKVSVQEQDGIIVVVPVTKKPGESLRGILKGRPSLIEALLKSREKERMREEKAASRHVRGSGLASG